MEDNTPSGAQQGEAMATVSPSPPPPAPTGEASTQTSTTVASVPEAPRRFMFPVKCTKCGADFEVPFNPDPNRPILCRTCRPVYPAKCVVCGKERQVPFKVGAGRPYRCPSCEAKMPPLPPPPKQGKPKDPAREAAKDAIRAVFKEVANEPPTSEQSSRIVALCKELYFGAADAPPSQEKKKDAGRQTAKEAMRAVFKEVGDREPTLEESACIVSLCRALFFGGSAAPVARPRAVGAQPIEASESATPSSGSKAALPPSTAPASTPPKETQKPKAKGHEPQRQKAARRAVVPIMQLKVAQPLRPEQLPRDVLPGEGAPNVEVELVFAVSSAPGKPVLPVRARFSSRNYRRALKAIEEHDGNAVVILQGRLTGDGELLGAGITVQPNKAPRAKEAADPVQGTFRPTADAPKKPPQPKEAAKASVQGALPPNDVAGASAPFRPSPEKKPPALPAPPFVVHPGERIGRWIVVHESPLKDGVRQVHCRCKKCGFRIDLAADELLAPVLPLCRRCE